MFINTIGKDIKLLYRSTEDNVIEDFYKPILSESKKYYRSTGYFSSNILISYIEGLEKFIDNSGKIRLIISPFLSLEDVQAIIDALNPNDEVKVKLSELFKSYKLNGVKAETAAQILTQLIRENYLEVKVVVPKSQKGLFHEKISLFYDEADAVIATNGSNNETQGAIQYNLETFNTFRSWLLGQDEYVKYFQKSFEDTWSNELKEYNTLNINEAVSQEVFKEYETSDSISDLYKKLNTTDTTRNKTDSQSNLKFVPYNYQLKAAEKWIKLKKGIISFATGTGKTKTAIYALQELINLEGEKIIFIIAPDKSLVEQWTNEIKEYWKNVVSCYSESPNWEKTLKNKIKFWKYSNMDSLFVVTTIPTFFSDRMNRQREKLNNDYILVADECHRLGTNSSLSRLPSVERRMGLSATPEIYMSPDKTEKLFKYFGDVIAEYSLKDAIEDKKLTEYEYFPIEVQLTTNEMEKYKKITHEIIKMIKSPEDELNFDNLSVEAQMKLFQRARIIYGAEEKLKKLNELLDTICPSKFMLIYCGATSISESDEHDDITKENEATSMRQIEIVNRMLSNKGIPAAQYTKDENGNERFDRIRAFKEGIISTLVAIKALDEGVDIPEISTGIILASSGNPREFVQRRGRLLRKSKGKEKAVIYDMVVLGTGEEYDGINRSELKRIKEFSKSAINRATLENRYQNLFTEFLEEENDRDY